MIEVAAALLHEGLQRLGDDVEGGHRRAERVP